ncbi:hypothetical protein [Sphingobium xenophagum]|uniref:hypothetical protein n=1 Tax=Sphingobium xenophagum TaxID=121428 RepID=UPI001C0DB757|nr:hypothetical protein [Sphingobium xenophagum]QWT16628.1 hypothetical protein GTV57_19660 [Sphingobium xenophagum]
MMHFTERALTEELAEARRMLEKALVILDSQEEHGPAYCVCDAIEQLIGAPSTIEQWYMMTGRSPAAEDAGNETE